MDHMTIQTVLKFSRLYPVIYILTHLHLQIMTHLHSDPQRVNG